MRLLISALAFLVANGCAGFSVDNENAPWSGPVAWILDPEVPVSPDSTRVGLVFFVPTCGSQGTLTPMVEYRPDEVAIEMHMSSVPNCLLAGGPARFEVALNEPLGNRQVVPLVQPPPTSIYHSLDQSSDIPYWSEIAP
jgi:hypothetical protein